MAKWNSGVAPGAANRNNRQNASHRMSPHPKSASFAEPSFAELFTPKLITVFREG
jgi:hypothetical protein